MYTNTPTRIADNKADLLDGRIQQAINTNEFGLYIDNPKFTWTSNLANGIAATDTCNNWTSTNGNLKIIL